MAILVYYHNILARLSYVQLLLLPTNFMLLQSPVALTDSLDSIGSATLSTFLMS